VIAAGVALIVLIALRELPQRLQATRSQGDHAAQTRNGNQDRGSD
jgi:hypothetical protein